MAQSTHERLRWNLAHHRPDEAQQERIEAIRAAAQKFADVICVNASESRELSMAATALEDATQYAIAAIARERT